MRHNPVKLHAVTIPGQANRVYLAKGRIGLKAAGFIAGGALFLLMLLVMFVLLLAVKQSKANDSMPGMIGGTSVVGIAFLTRGIMLLRGKVRVVLDDFGVHLEGFISRNSIPWNQIADIQRGKRTAALGGHTSKTLTLVDDSGKARAEISDTIDGFEEMATEIIERSSAARGQATFNAVAEEARRTKKETRSRRAAIVLFSILGLAFLSMFVAGAYEEVHVCRYASEGVRVDAAIRNRHMLRVTPYVEYSFADASGALHSRETMIEQSEYDLLEGALTIPVEYLRSNPDWNRPVAGENHTSLGGKFLFLSGGLSLLMCICFVFALLGFDIKTEDGVTVVTRKGKVIRTLGSKSPRKTEPPQGFPPVMPSPSMPPVWAPVAEFPGPSVPNKPRGLIALGVLSVIFGVLGLGVGALRWRMSRMHTINLSNGRYIELESPWFADYLIAANVALAMLLVITGIGLMAVKPWSRALGMVVAMLQIVASIVAIGFVISVMRQSPETTGPNSMTLVAANTGAIVGQVVGMIFPLVLLLILARRSTAASLSVSSPPAI